MTGLFAFYNGRTEYLTAGFRFDGYLLGEDLFYEHYVH
jgi:hypothetical protein